MSPLVIIALVIAVVLVIGYVLLTMFVKKAQSRGVDEMTETMGGADAITVIDDQAVCRGTESEPFNEYLGMGAMALNSERLRFVRWDPRAEFELPRAAIREHVFTTEWKGRATKSPLLQITFDNPDWTDGEDEGVDHIVFEVKDPDAWNAALD